MHFLPGDAGQTKLWQLSSIQLDGESIPVNEWEVDDMRVWNYDGTVLIVSGEVDHPAPSDYNYLKVHEFQWQLKDGSFRFFDYNSRGDLLFEFSTRLIKLTDTELVTERVLGDGTVETAVHVPAVTPNPNASSANKALTGGLSKIWSVSQITENGTSVPLSDWQKDDHIIFNTDGTAYFTYGEEQPEGQELGLNDLRNWQFNADETQISFTNENDHYLAPEAAETHNIIELTSTRFVYENGTQVITLVPFLK